MGKTGTDIFEAEYCLREGKLVAIPTETVYGLAANAYNLEAVASIFSAKNRPFFDPLILHCANKEAAFSLFKEFPDEYDKLADAFWPGPLTLAAPKNAIIPDLITAGSPIVAVRVPAHPLTLSLLQLLDFPLAAPSANPFGYVSPTTAKHVFEQLGGKIDYIIDGGECKVGIESTILGYKDNKIQLWRLGGTSIENIEDILEHKIDIQINKSSNPDSSGQLDKHYSPNTKMILLDDEDFRSYIHSLSEKVRTNKALLVFGNKKTETGFREQLNLSVSGNYNEAAHNLYAFIRNLDSKNYEKIIALRLPDEGLGRAINDRLLRASTK
ncbi:MAG: threonylcarbamoyl-AMP synthase [Bacteroidetes bacterium]|nr:threonylcarbamoyl-AMP synthase [Bacteroidota bacterium]